MGSQGDILSRNAAIAGLEEAIRLGQEAVDATPLDHPDRGRRVDNLALRLRDRYWLTGEMVYLERAIHLAWDAINITPSNHPDLAGLLNDLDNVPLIRYERSGSLQDQAISNGQNAVFSTSMDNEAVAGRLHSLSNMPLDQHSKPRDLQDIEAAISNTQEAVVITAQDHLELVGQSNSLRNVLSFQFKRLGNPQDLEAAISNTQEAIAMTPVDRGHPDLAGRLMNHASMLSTRYGPTGQMEDYEVASQLAQQAVHVTPDDHPDRVARTASLRVVQTCVYCKSVRHAERICPWRDREVRLGLRNSGKKFRNIVINSFTSDRELRRQLSVRYNEQVKLFTRLTRVYALSANLYIVRQQSTSFFLHL